MKILFTLFLLTFIFPVYAGDPFKDIEKALMGSTLEKSMNPWELKLTKKEWKRNLENCYDRNVNPSAKKALIELLAKNGHNMPPTLSAREVDTQLSFYCFHTLLLANDIGFKLSIVSLDPGNVQLMNQAAFIQDCYLFRKNGFAKKFRGQIIQFIKAGEEALKQDKNAPISVQKITMILVGMCGAMFAKDNNAPLHVSFTSR